MLGLSENTTRFQTDHIKLLTLCLVVRNIKISCVFRIHLHALPHFGILLMVEFFIFTSRKCILKTSARVNGQLARVRMLVTSSFAG